MNLSDAGGSSEGSGTDTPPDPGTRTGCRMAGGRGRYGIQTRGKCSRTMRRAGMLLPVVRAGCSLRTGSKEREDPAAGSGIVSQQVRLAVTRTGLRKRDGSMRYPEIHPAVRRKGSGPGAGRQRVRLFCRHLLTGWWDRHQGQPSFPGTNQWSGLAWHRIRVEKIRSRAENQVRGSSGFPSPAGWLVSGQRSGRKKSRIPSGMILQDGARGGGRSRGVSPVQGKSPAAIRRSGDRYPLMPGPVA